MQFAHFVGPHLGVGILILIPEVHIVVSFVLPGEIDPGARNGHYVGRLAFNARWRQAESQRHHCKEV